MALRTLDGSLAVAIMSLLGEGVNHQPDPEGTFLLPPVGDIFIALQHYIITLNRRMYGEGSSRTGLRLASIRLPVP